ncbi:hypothetical protein [Mucilaginibacter sp. AK015]|uniref:hypothetical protein n=1 Tax=Mucilaginibacter sp. AK015 TaxID=2723072 RepID=UPI001610A82E|nr:hypothetical protein [Mucilaginibacter sp. AK015]MBB5397118.1 translation elongation factor EF-Tu-like GTPase [Mucilaginibacter sp. AK015]
MEYYDVAKFKVSDAFSITNRGMAVAGEIITGEINNGNYLKLTLEDKELIYKIGSVEFLKTETAANIALLIQSDNNPELYYLERAIGQPLIILSLK